MPMTSNAAQYPHQTALAGCDMCCMLTQAIIVSYVCLQPIIRNGDPAQTTQHRQQQIPIHDWLLC